MTDSFVALDVETANSDFASICQIGLVCFVGQSIKWQWTKLIDPEDYFDSENIRIHGIEPRAVAGAPNFPAILEKLQPTLRNQIVVSHTHFDRLALDQACDKYGVQLPPFTWLDSARVARRTWPEVRARGYGLADLAARLEINFQHHDAGEDARAAGMIILSAIAESGTGLRDWIERARKPTPKVGKIEGDPEGALYGETLVITGELFVTRRVIAEFAAQLGCNVGASVTKKTTMLVVGDQYLKKLAGHRKSTKHRKAEALIQAGQQIRIFSETEFLSLLKDVAPPEAIEVV